MICFAITNYMRINIFVCWCRIITRKCSWVTSHVPLDVDKYDSVALKNSAAHTVTTFGDMRARVCFKSSIGLRQVASSLSPKP